MGQMGPQVLAPEEIITVPSAFITGLKVGGAKSSMEVESGLAYLEMLENGVSEETARALATGVGLANAGLEFLQLDELVKAFKVLDKTGADDALRSTILRELTRRGIDAATEAGQETLQEAVTMGGVQLGSRWDNGHWAYSAEDMGQRLGQTFGDALLTFGLTNVPAAAHNINTSDSPLAAAGEARLLSGEMPSQDQLRAMDMSESEALGHLAVMAMEGEDDGHYNLGDHTKSAFEEAQSMPKDLDEILTSPQRLSGMTGQDLHNYLVRSGYDVQPLSRGSYKGISFEDGGGFKVNWGGDRILQYHPAKESHHGGEYFKISSGETGTIRIDLEGNIIK